MIDFDVAPFIQPTIVAAQAAGSDPFHPARRMQPSVLSVSREVVQVGEAVYRLRAPLTLTFYPYSARGKGELVAEPNTADPAGWYPAGLGVTFEEAYSDWADKLHMFVQNLVGKRPWEMSDDEASDMAAIERTIDIPAYHRDTPFVVRQIGTVAHRRPVPDRIEWEDGTVERVRLDQMPPEFAAFAKDQRFEAIVTRDSLSGRLRRVVYVGRMGRLKPESAERWAATPTSRQSPEVGWDEID